MTAEVLTKGNHPEIYPPPYRVEESFNFGNEGRNYSTRGTISLKT